MCLSSQVIHIMFGCTFKLFRSEPHDYYFSGQNLNELVSHNLMHNAFEEGEKQQHN